MTDKTRQIIELRKAGKSYEDVAAILGCTLKSVERACETYGFTYRKTLAPEKAWHKEIKALRLEGLTYEEVANRMGISYSRVSDFCKKHGLSYKSLGQKAPYKSRVYSEEALAKLREIIKKAQDANRGLHDKTKQIIDLRKQGKNYEEITVLLGCSMKSVRYACNKYNYAYKDIENAWKEKVADLRREGYDYTDIAEILNVDHDKVEIFCACNGLKYADLGDSPYHKSSDKLKGRDVINWSERVNAVTDGNFRLISNKLNSKGEQSLIVECVKCGTRKTVSSISLRGKGRITCLTCRAERLAKEREQRRELDKVDREIKEWQKNYERGKSLIQVEMNFCKCGKLLPFGIRVCDDCKQETKRNIYRRAEHKRRIRERRAFDRTVTLDKLYERDKGICYICNKTCDWSDFQKVNGAFVVGGSYPTVEHVKALCNGGTHTWDNVKLACFACNTKKGRK